MKYSMFAATLALALGSGTAFASLAPDPQDSQDPASDQESRTPASSSDEPQANAAEQNANEQPIDPVERAKGLQPVDVLFEFDSARLGVGTRNELLTLARWAKCNAKGAVILEGHTDSTGTQAYNMKLSGERAASVRAKLIEMGVPSDRIVVTLYGQNGPRRGSAAEDRRVTVRATTSPVQPADITASR
jgi:outer membrane protein OmpA-like peptidoglycan-associated protein